MSPTTLPLIEGSIDDVLAARATYALVCADALDGLRAIPNNSIDFGLMDPPYGLGTREPTGEDIIAYLQGAALDTGGDFMSQTWSIPPVALWREVLRVLKPGNHLAVYAGTQTDDLLSIGIRAAGFERRDAIELFGTSRLAWVQAQGMAKGLNLSKAIDEAAGREREVVGDDPEVGRRNKSTPKFDGIMNEYDGIGQVPITAPATPEAHAFDGYHTNVAPKHEVVLLFAKPLDAVTCTQIHAATGWDHWHVTHDIRKPPKRAKVEEVHGVTLGTYIDDDGTETPREARIVTRRPLHAGVDGWSEVQARAKGGEWEVLATYDRRPYKSWTSRTVVANALVHGSGGLHIDACRVGTDWSDRPESWFRRTGQSSTDDDNGLKIVNSRLTPRGRFAPNVLYSHGIECEPIGEKHVKGTSKQGPNGGCKKASARFGSFNGYEPGYESFSYANGDGTETVDAYRCLVGCRACMRTWLAESGGVSPACECGVAGEWICAVAHLDEQGGNRPSGAKDQSRVQSRNVNCYGTPPIKTGLIPADDGCASRYFPVLHPAKYAAKASKGERDAGMGGDKNEHVAVKPIEHVLWVAQLIGGRMGNIGLTCFAGSGSEVGAMVAEGYRVIGIEREAKHVATAQRRVPALATMKRRKVKHKATAARKGVKNAPVAQGKVDATVTSDAPTTTAKHSTKRTEHAAQADQLSLDLRRA